MNIQNDYPLLNSATTPDKLKKLSLPQLSLLANEIRHFLIKTLDVSGGHFASSLGALELTVAIHYCFDTPKDHIVWDVGHQTYIHKILTGRMHKLSTIKKENGLSGFPRRSESEYDAFIGGHSSNSISAALGMSAADKIKSLNTNSVAVIGDGALTAGMAFEALNHAGGLNADMLVILNDNEMSISENVGGLSLHLSKLLASPSYDSFRETGKKILNKIPPAFDFVKKIEQQAKGMFVPANLFEALGFYYVGPIDGHDIPLLVETLDVLKKHTGPKLLHVITKKGKGYKKAEENPIKFHHVSPKFHSSDDQSKTSKPTYSNIFGSWLCDKASVDDKLVGITPAMREGSDMVEFSKKFPNRYFDVAIAEQHAVTFAAGMACEGLKPVVAIYSTFLQRAYDQFIHDVSIQNLDVLYAVDRAGLVGEDGPTHAGSFDLSFLRCIPNTIIMTPSDENECYHMLDFGYNHKGPAVVRYPRGCGVGAEITKELPISLGKANTIKSGASLAILNFGTLLPIAIKASDILSSTVIDMRFVKPIDSEILQEVVNKHKYIITLEENAIAGGAGSAINEYLAENDMMQDIKIRNIGLPDLYLEHANKDKILERVNVSVDGIIQTYNNMNT